MKKFLALILVLGVVNMASGAFVLDIKVNGDDWDGQSPVVPSDIISLGLRHDASLGGGILNSNVNVSDGDPSSASFSDPASGWLLAGGEMYEQDHGFDMFFNGAVLFPRAAADIWHVEFHVPDLDASSYIIIDANGGYWDGSNADEGSGDGLPYAMIHVIPEPMTMSLLGLGGLALIRRRRA